MPPTDYADYLCLSELLSLQRTRSDLSAPTFAAEHLFIVTHQVSELLLKHVIVDLAEATAILDDGATAPGDVSGRLTRAAAVTDVMTAATETLRVLPVAEFHTFRPLLGSASGMQSRQFHRLYSLLGLPRGASPLFRAFEAALRRRGATLDEVYAGPTDDGMVDVAERLADLALAIRRWQVAHIELVNGMVGDDRGTGGTAGVDFLAGRLELAFPALWSSRGNRERDQNHGHSPVEGY